MVASWYALISWGINVARNYSARPFMKVFIIQSATQNGTGLIAIEPMTQFMPNTASVLRLHGAYTLVILLKHPHISERYIGATGQRGSMFCECF